MLQDHSKANISRKVESMPVLSANDAADYLSEMLPQMANIARQSNLGEIADMISLAASFARKVRVKLT